MRELSHTAVGWLFKQDAGAWGIYVACKYNPDRHKEIAALAADEQREFIREVYERDAGEPR